MVYHGSFDCKLTHHCMLDGFHQLKLLLKNNVVLFLYSEIRNFVGKESVMYWSLLVEMYFV